MKLPSTLAAALLLAAQVQPTQAQGYQDRWIGWNSRNHCTLSPAGDFIGCPSTDGAALTTSLTIDRGSRGISFDTVHAEVGLSSMSTQMELSSIPNWDHIEGDLHAAQFDTYLVQGPTPTVQLDVSLHFTFIGEDRPHYSRAYFSFWMGWRQNATPCSCTGDLNINPMGWVPNYVSMWNYTNGQLWNPVDTSWTGSFTAPVGQSFELGEHAIWSIAGLKLTSGVDWQFSLPQGYSMTSARGLAVNISPIPEPATAWLWLAALPVWAARRLRRLTW